MATRDRRRDACFWPKAARCRLSPGSGEDRLAADFGFGTGTHTRYGRLAAHDTRIYYDDWQPREARCPATAPSRSTLPSNSPGTRC